MKRSKTSYLYPSAKTLFGSAVNDSERMAIEERPDGTVIITKQYKSGMGSYVEDEGSRMVGRRDPVTGKISGLAQQYRSPFGNHIRR